MFPDLEILLAVTGTFERLDVPYLVGGSVASSALGVFRTTLDADVVADLQARHVEPFVAALRSDFYLDDQRIRHAIARRSSFNLIHLAKALKVDVYLPSLDAFSRSQLARRPRIEAPGADGATFYPASAEDVVLQKLRGYRLCGESSERQWLDVLGVLKVQRPTFDRGDAARWADEIEVADLLARAHEDAGYPA
ncbi:MAG: hypothetical protein AMXMBFR36_11250 [Acidobacteriota bacterium]